METYRVKVRGTEPWLQNKLTLEAVKEMYAEHEKEPKDDEYRLKKRNQWRETCMFDPKDGSFYVPLEYIEGNLKRGGASLRLKQQVLRGVRVRDNDLHRYPLVLPPGPKPKTFEEIETLGWVAEHIVKQDRKPNTRRRLCIPTGWQFEYDLLVDESVFKTKNTLRKIIEKGGEIGFADWNPRFGTFEVLSVEKVAE